MDEARRCGPAVHLCDEYPYPSGIAGGWVTEGTPEHMATTLVHERHVLSEGETVVHLPRGRVLSATAFSDQGSAGLERAPRPHA